MSIVCPKCIGFCYFPLMPANISMTLFVYEVCKVCKGTGVVEGED